MSLTETPFGSARPASPAGRAGLTGSPSPEEPPRKRRFPGHVPGEVGIWIFIIGDMMMYAILLISFMVDRGENVGLFERSRLELHINYGMINAVLLITSSLCVALGIRSIRDRVAMHLAPRLFAVAIACSIGFMIIKYIEYSSLIRDGINPTENTFFVYYYLLTGVHLSHLIAGTGVLLFLLKMSKKKEHTPRQVSGMESGASFWHVVDLLWIALFSTLYLVS